VYVCVCVCVYSCLCVSAYACGCAHLCRCVSSAQSHLGTKVRTNVSARLHCVLVLPVSPLPFQVTCACLCACLHVRGSAVKRASLYETGVQLSIN
jgi:hypothetical protein